MADGSSGPEQKTPPAGVDPNEVRDWYFTFRFTQDGHGNDYVVLRGTWQGARDAMVAQFGRRWSRQWRTAEDAGVYRFGLTKLTC